ncbi:MAG TPA: N-formylglutamate amidohydrolase, partial [Polyangiaceae bacterium]
FERDPPKDPGLSPAAVITCEHASERLPDGWRWPDTDARLLGTHWAYDLGAAELARALAAELGSVAVLAGFSRLLADPNRPEDSPDLFRLKADGMAVGLNAGIDPEERNRRLLPWRAYHDAVDAEVSASMAPIVFSMHTFTPVYEGTPRAVEIGVLFDDEDALAATLREALVSAGFNVAMNEPYSGKFGLMYSVDRHARCHGRRAIELEVRQDLAVNPETRSRVVLATAPAVRSCAREMGLPGRPGC